MADSARVWSFPRPVLGLARACHPDAVVAVTVVAGALAVATGRDPRGVVAVVVAVLAGQLSIGWLNDGLDAGRDRDAGRPDKPVAAGLVTRRTTLAAAATAGLACVPLSLLSGPLAGGAHLVAVAAGWAYDFGVKATVASVLCYAVAFGLLPGYVALGLPGAAVPPWWLPTTGALLGCGAHFANTLPDLATDLAVGVRGLPHRLGVRGSTVAATVFLVAASLVLAFAPPGAPSALGLVAVPVSVLVLVAGFLLGRRPGSRAPFRAVLIVALLDVTQLVIAGLAVRHS